MPNIFVGNLSYQTTQGDLEAAFSPYGSVDRVNVVTDRETGQPRGFAFIEMSDQQGAQMAISQLNGTDLHGRTLNVNEARPKPAGRSNGGHGGGNSSGFARNRREPRW